MNKEREICGVKVIVSGETYNKYKGTLEEQLEQKDKEIERLNNIIKNTLEYIPAFRTIIQSHEPGLTCLKVLEDKLKGGNNE